MSYILNLRSYVPFLAQKRYNWCGAACAQMTMDGYPDPACRILIDQGPPLSPNCWDTIQAHNSTDQTDLSENWSTDPRGLFGCLMELNPPPGWKWEIYKDTDPQEVLKSVLTWMYKYRYPAPILVNSGYHWVLVTGFVTDVAPALGKTATLLYITVHDPEPVGIGCICTRDAATWLKTYWKYPNDGPGSWFNEYVALAKPEGLRLIINVNDMDRFGRIKFKPPRALKLAYKYIDELGLAEQPAYSALGQEDIKSQAPILVREEIGPVINEDDLVPYYYIIPFGLEHEVSRSEKPLARVSIIVNAFTGRFEEVCAFGKPVPYLSKDEAIHIAAGKLGFNEEEFKKLAYNKKVKAELIFRPSNITHNRAYPFYKVTIDKQTIYIDQSGKAHKVIRRSRRGN